MTYNPTPLIIDPQPPEARVWRYMSLAKLVSVLDKRALFFPSVAHLQRNDPFEGSYAVPNYAAAPEDYNDAPPEMRAMLDPLPNSPGELDEASRGAACKWHVSCWHRSDYESAAMWILYLVGNEGVAIQSTIRHLKTCFQDSPGTQHMADVVYRDYEKNFIPVYPPEAPPATIMLKRQSFEHEKELRVLVRQRESEDAFERADGAGIYVPCDLNMLVEHVFVAPTRPVWFREAVQSVLEHYGLQMTVAPSRLDQPPPSS